MVDQDAPAGTPAATPASGPAAVGLDDAGLRALIEELGGKPFQAKQVRHWLFERGAPDWQSCHNLPKALREKLEQRLKVRSSVVETVDRSNDGTRKLLLRLHDGETVETVIIPDGDRTTLCISSQVGCPVACIFCASGLAGVRRNLRRDEILEQFLHARDLLQEEHRGHTTARFTNLVVMGLGEPMLNLAELEPALARLSDPEAIGLGARRITVSTSGHPAQMRKWATAEGSYALAVSLHAADDELRKELVPTAHASVAEIIEAAREYGQSQRREVTYEVVLLADVNDRPQDADALIRVLKDERCTVNLIPWNPVAEIQGLARPTNDRVDAFADRLRDGGLNVTVRRQRGADRSAACGQLRLHHAKA